MTSTTVLGCVKKTISFNNKGKKYLWVDFPYHQVSNYVRFVLLCFSNKHLSFLLVVSSMIFRF